MTEPAEHRTSTSSSPPRPAGSRSCWPVELRELGARDASVRRAGVSFVGDLESVYRVCLWSRLASRVLLPLHTWEAPTPEALYDGVRAVDWSRHLDVDGTFAVEFVSVRSDITHTHYGALKVKDAVVDQFRDATGRRPSIDTVRPGRTPVRLPGQQHGDRQRRLRRREPAQAALPGSGRAGRGAAQGEPGRRAAPAGGMARGRPRGGCARRSALRVGHPADRRCADGRRRGPRPAAARTTGSWAGVSTGRTCGAGLLDEARERRRRGEAQHPSDLRLGRRSPGDPDGRRQPAPGGAVRSRRRCSVASWPNSRLPPAATAPGLVITNPPYGERLGDQQQLEPLYALLGERLSRDFVGWKAAVFTGNPELAHRIGLRARRYYSLYNGAIPARLFLFELDGSPARERRRRPPGPRARRPRPWRPARRRADGRRAAPEPGRPVPPR